LKKLYVLPCSKTLNCIYFKNIFNDKPSYENEIEVSKKQQYFINGCHKICFSCIENLHAQEFAYIKSSECVEENIFDFSYCKELINMWLCTSFRIHDLKEFHHFHDIYERF